MLAVFIPAGFGFFRDGDKAGDSGLVLHKTDGIVRLASGDFNNAPASGPGDLTNVTAALKDTYGVKDTDKEFAYVKTLETPFGYTHKLAQIYRGYPVFGRSVNVSADKDGNVMAVSGNYLKNAAPRNRVKISAQEANRIIEGLYPDAVIFSDSLEIYSLEGTKPVFAYNVSTSWEGGTRFFVDAQTGKVIKAIATAATETIPTVPHATRQKDYYNNDAEVILDRTAEEGEDGHTYYLADCLRNIYLVDAKNGMDFTGDYYQNKTGVFNDKVAVSAFLNFVASFDFYAEAANIGVSLRGIDGSIDKIHDNAETADEIMTVAYLHYGQQYENAAYISGLKEQYPKEAVFIFGDGRPDGLFDLAVARDVVGHEYQHAITAFSADLIYLNAAGAINEAFSDVFGALIEGHEMTDDRFWLCGEEITSPSNKKAIRDMKDPGSLNYPDYYKGPGFHQFCYQNHDHGGCDNGGVHYNSSIAGHAAYEMWNLKPELFTKELTGELWYTTLLMLPQDAEFEDLRIIMRQAAINLGYGGEIIDTIGLAFDHVGVFGAAGLHTVTFNKGGMTGDAPASITRYYGEKFTVSECNLAADGYEHAGWSESGTTDEKIYYTGQTYKMPGRDMTLYPVKIAKMWNGLTPSVLKGAGQPHDPYQIGTAADLATLAYYINNANVIASPYDFNNAYVKMTADIDLLNVPWLPIGTEKNLCRLFFDGGFHKIRNLKIEFGRENDYYCAGLFGCFAEGSISDLGIESGSIDTYARYAGGIIGYGGSVPINNCYSKISVTNREEDCVAGGIAGYIYGDINRCYNTGDITSAVAGGIFGVREAPYRSNIYLIAQTSGDFVIGNCYNTGAVTGGIAGGIGGRCSAASIINCINTGAVKTLEGVTSGGDGGMAGGIAGGFAHVYLSDLYLTVNMLGCKNTGTVSGFSGAHTGALIGGALSYAAESACLRMEKNHYKNQNGLPYIGNIPDFTAGQRAALKGEAPKGSDDNPYSGVFDFDSADYYNNLEFWVVALGVGIFDIGIEWETAPGAMPSLKKTEYWIESYASGFAGGAGTETNPYLIKTPEQLARLAHLTATATGGNYNACFKLTADIDLAGKAWSGIGCSYGKLMDFGFGSGYTNNFGGSFDGGGYVIRNMRARDYSWYTPGDREDIYYYYYTSGAALFSDVGWNSNDIMEIYGFSLENINSAGNNAAGVCAQVNAASSGKVIIRDIEVSGIVCGASAAGGVIAENEMIFGGHVTVQGCKVTGTVSGKLAGGITGAVRARQSISKGGTLVLNANVNMAAVTSYNQESFNFPNAAGGILGAAHLEKIYISNCINTGNIQSFGVYSAAGGIMGGRNQNVNSSVMDIKIEYCKQTGAIQARESLYTGAGALIGYFGRDIHLTDAGKEIRAALKNNAYAEGLPAFTDSRSGLVTVTCSGNTISTDEAGTGDFAYYDLEYFFDPVYFNSDRYLSCKLYYFFNGQYPTRTVIFKDYDGTVLFELAVLYRNPAVVPDPSRTPTATEVFPFVGWDKDIGEVTEDMEVTAVYSSAVRLYTVTFMDGGRTVGVRYSEYGGSITLPEDPVKDGYRFKGWFTDERLTVKYRGGAITEDFTIYAKFEKNWFDSGSGFPVDVFILCFSAATLFLLAGGLILVAFKLKKGKKSP